MSSLIKTDDFRASCPAYMIVLAVLIAGSISLQRPRATIWSAIHFSPMINPSEFSVLQLKSACKKVLYVGLVSFFRIGAASVLKKPSLAKVPIIPPKPAIRYLDYLDAWLPLMFSLNELCKGKEDFAFISKSSSKDGWSFISYSIKVSIYQGVPIWKTF